MLMYSCALHPFRTNVVADSVKLQLLCEFGATDLGTMCLLIEDPSKMHSADQSVNCIGCAASVECCGQLSKYNAGPSVLYVLMRC